MRDIDDAGWMEDKCCRGLSSKRQRERANSLKKALAALRLIAKDFGAENQFAEAKKIKRRLLRQIENQKAARLRDQRYDARIRPWRIAVERPNERWARHLVRLETNRQSIGRLRGIQQMDRKKAIEWAIDNAASVKAEELTPAERRAVEMLERGAGQNKG